MSDKSNLPPLPSPSVEYITNFDDIDDAATHGMMSNPIYIGVPPYPRVVSDETWVRAATELIKEQGPEQFLVNMLYMLRASMVDATPDEAIPEDYDGPWPEEDAFDELSLDDDWADFDEGPSPWRHRLEGSIFCSHDDLPMLKINGQFTCVAEYLNAHISNAPITDLITEPLLSLVFQNGHTLPLLCPDCGESLHVFDYNELLDDINGLTVIDIDWDEDIEELILDFGRPGSDKNESDDPPMLAVHLDSVRELTCPHHQDIWDGEDLPF